MNEAGTINCSINMQAMTLQCPNPMARLLDVLRQTCKLTGTKEGCGEGECGACAVFLNGKLVNSCLVPIAQVQGAEITTIEGAFSDSLGMALKKAFLEKGASQCGACTPGMVLAALDLLRSNQRPTLDEVKKALAGNLCRCTGYTRIFEGVIAAAWTLEVERC